MKEKNDSEHSKSENKHIENVVFSTNKKMTEEELKDWQDSASHHYVTVSGPSFCDVSDLKRVSFFERHYYVDGVYFGKIIYALSGALHEDALVDAIERINPLKSEMMKKRIEQEKFITPKRIFEEINEKMRDECFNKVEWYSASKAIFKIIFSDLSQGYLDRELPVEEALSKWVSSRFPRSLR